METLTGINIDLVRRVLGMEKLKNFIFNTQRDLSLEYSGLDGRQIAEVEYVQSIYLRRRQQFDAVLQEIENKETPLQKVKDFLAKISPLSFDVIQITVNGKTLDLVKYLEGFTVPDLKKDQRVEIPFELKCGDTLILSDAISMSEYSGKVHLSVANLSIGFDEPLVSLYGAFRSHIEEKYITPTYENYLQKNDLTAIAKDVAEKIRLIEKYTYRLELKEAREELNALDKLLLDYETFNYFFTEAFEKLAFQARFLSDQEKISDPNMPMIERIYLCKNYQLDNFIVVPGDGKRFVVAMHGIHLYGEERKQIVDYLTENGFGGSIIISAGVGVGFFEHFLIKEGRLGAIIHNTGMWHESTLSEILDHSWTSKKDNDFCYSIPHNENGAHGSEHRLMSKNFLDKITNFF